MCGIFGATSLTPQVLKMLPILACHMENRGHDSWGASNGQDTFRSLGRITDTWGIESDRFTSWEGMSAIFHTRSASTGDVTIENAHPLVCETSERAIVGIHNGCIYNHDELNIEYSRSFTVDSQHIFQHIAERSKLKDIYGWAALAWFEIDKSLNQISPLKLGWFGVRNLYLARLPDSVCIRLNHAGNYASMWNCRSGS